jgi:hypothetical protein
MPLLIIWLLINIAAVVFWLYKAFHSDDWISLFLYPEIHDKLEDEEVGLAGKLFIDILFSIIFLPAMVLYFTAVFIILTLASVLFIIQMFFVRIFSKK